jgi:hypothetical protein
MAARNTKRRVWTRARLAPPALPGRPLSLVLPRAPGLSAGRRAWPSVNVDWWSHMTS